MSQELDIGTRGLGIKISEHAHEGIVTPQELDSHATRIRHWYRRTVRQDALGPSSIAFMWEEPKRLSTVAPRKILEGGETPKLKSEYPCAIKTAK
jgi:hypothetical protein